MAKHDIRRWKNFRYKGLLGTLILFLLIGAVLFAERSGVQYDVYTLEHSYLPEEKVLTAEQVQPSLPVTCLMLMDSSQPESAQIVEQFQRIFLDMKVGYDCVDVNVPLAMENTDLEKYQNIVLMIADYGTLGEEVIRIAKWVEQGGRAMLAVTPFRDTYSMLLEQKMGILSAGWDYTMVESIHPSEDFMLGGGRDYIITDPFESSWQVELSDQAKLHAWSGGEKKVPIVWEADYGEGKFVVTNIGIYDKNMRGFYAAAYSLLGDCTVYPVINGSAFYLDDFPSPVPSGDGEYVKRDYGLSIEDFYKNIWWPDMMNMADKYGVRYTAVTIETYEDDTESDPRRNPDMEQFLYFGNMLLDRRSELGYHGYNHQPLSLENVDYGDVLPYNTWSSYEQMRKSIEELVGFMEELFPTVPKSVYVPPSNVLSPEGRQMLTKEFPHIRTLASNFFPGEFAYYQEFEVAEDGIVEQPRVISGCVLDDYMRISALSELNMHFVSNHFMHPDDLLDEDRGAETGWEPMRETLDGYMNWLYTSAPPLRRMTGSELSGAIQRFAAVTVEKREYDGAVLLDIGNLYDEAYFFVRVNEGTPGTVSGGTLEKLTDSLYLLRADSERVRIEISR